MPLWGILMQVQACQPLIGEIEQGTPSTSLLPTHLSFGNFRTFQSLVQSSIRQSTSIGADRTRHKGAIRITEEVSTNRRTVTLNECFKPTTEGKSYLPNV